MKKTYLFALVSSIGLLVVSYLLQNSAIPFNGDETLALKRVSHITNIKQKEYADCENCKWIDSLLLINGCYDLDTIPHYFDNELIPDGYYAITSRKDIYKTLLALQQDNTYKYILLDIALTRLPDGYNEYTDSITRLLPQMQRIVIARSKDNFLMADSSLIDSMAGYVDYVVNPEETGFSKFNIMGSAPLKIYEDLHDRKVKRCLGGLLYTDGYALCRRTIIPSYFLTQDSLFCNSEEWGTQKLFADLKDVAQYGSLGYNFHNKIIVIGDYLENDMHQTIAGDLSGALILLNIYLNLVHRFHIVSWWFTLLLFVIYFIFSVLIVIGNKLWTMIPFWRKFWTSEIVQMIFELIGWAFIFHWISVAIYWGFGQIYNPFIAIIWFTIIPKIYVTLTSKQ